METCKHGETDAHGEIGKDWCAGPPRSWYFEAGWRRQLEDQMNLNTDMFTRFAIPGEQTARMSTVVDDQPIDLWPTPMAYSAMNMAE